MKLTFLGVGSHSATQQLYHSNMLLTADSGAGLLIDCGGDIRFSLAEQGIQAKELGRALDAVYISHLHSDHIGGLEWLAFTCYFGAPRRRLRTPYLCELTMTPSMSLRRYFP